ncbi:MAG: amino acid ABC transporter substrate-binding protein [Lachnospiraceae bacterium]|nr:amino acid ABC transporter substrate-binding protein [Lachnospiraceae bacterium]
MKIKKIVALALVAAMSITVLAGCGTKTTNESGETAKEATVDMSNVTLINDGILTIGAEIGYPPFEDFADDGVTPIGYDIDLVNAIAEKMGVKAEFINTSFDGILAGIGVNYDAVASAITITDERKEEVLFSTPYISNYQAVVVPKGSDIKVSALTDLNGMSIALQKGTTSDAIMNDYKSTGTIDCTILATEQILQGYTQMSNGEVDVVVCDSVVAEGFVASSPDKYEIAFIDNGEPEEFGIAVGLENTPLQVAINEAMAQLEEEGYFEEAAAYWFGSGE